MVGGVASLNAWLPWPMYALNPEPPIALSRYSNGIVECVGVGFSLVLARRTFLP